MGSPGLIKLGSERRETRVAFVAFAEPAVEERYTDADAVGDLSNRWRVQRFGANALGQPRRELAAWDDFGIVAFEGGELHLIIDLAHTGNRLGFRRRLQV